MGPEHPVWEGRTPPTLTCGLGAIKLLEEFLPPQKGLGMKKEKETTLFSYLGAQTQPALIAHLLCAVRSHYTCPALFPEPASSVLPQGSDTCCPLAWNTHPASLTGGGLWLWEPIVKYPGTLQAG